MEVKNKYAYVITQDICNKFIEVNFLWDVWFHGQIVYRNIEHMSNIDEIYLEYEIENYNRAISICGCLVVMQLF